MAIKKFRQDFGDVRKLAESMDEYGQITEVVKTKDGVTIDGGRRELAFDTYLKGKSSTIKKLREYRLPLTLDELEKTGLFTLLQIEANTERKNFTIQEVDNIRKHLESLRQSGKLPDRFKGTDTREIVGQITHHGSRNVSKIAEIITAVKDKTIDSKYIGKIDKGLTSINTVHKIATRPARNLPKVKIPKGQYDCVLIDFPIRYDNDTVRGGASDHYPTMPLKECMDDARKFPIADNAIIFLWMTKPMRFDHQVVPRLESKVVRPIDSTMNHLVWALGMDVKDEFVWVKNKVGIGSYTRSQHEYLLIGFKGKPVVPAKAFPSVISAKVTEHSSKPQVWDMIKEMYPKRKYFECYRRDIIPGVDGFGNQTRGVDWGGSTEKITTTSISGDTLKVSTEILPIEKLRNKKK